MEAIRRNPDTWSRLDDKYHRKLLQQFPYGVIYHLPEAGCFEVVAIMHLHREPGYWRGRNQ